MFLIYNNRIFNLDLVKSIEKQIHLDGIGLLIFTYANDDHQDTIQFTTIEKMDIHYNNLAEYLG